MMLGKIRTSGATVGVLVVLTAAAAACGAEDDSTSPDDQGVEVSGDYCTDIKALRGRLAMANPAQLFADLGAVPRIAAEAPAEVASDWETFAAAVDEYESTLSEAGLTPEDVVGGRQELDLSDREGRALSTEIMKIFLNQELADAGKHIRSHALEACGVDLVVEEASEHDRFCDELGQVDILKVDPTAKQATVLAGATDRLMADAPAELEGLLRTVADGYRELGKIKDDEVRSMAFLGADGLVDAATDVVKWSAHNC